MKVIKIIPFIILLPCSAFVSARIVEIDLSLYSKGTMLVNSSRGRQSADYWHQLSNRIIASEAKLGTQAMWQYAGLSEALAAIAANEYNDIKAYEYWSNSTRYLLTGGTEWPQMQKYLHRRYEQINTQLSTQLSVSNVSVSLDNEWQQELTILQIWESKLGMFSFKGPKLGLKSKSNTAQERSVVITPNYHSSRSNLEDSGSKKLTGLGASFSRGQSFVPISTGNTELASPSLTKTASEPQINASDLDAKKLVEPEYQPEVQGVVVITPDEEFDYRLIEKDPNNNEREIAVDTEAVELPQEKEYNPIHKVNIGNMNSNNVEVLQRRTFIPIITDEK